MFDSFILAVGAVVPFLIYLSIGYLVVRFKWTDRPFLEKLNTLVFRVLFPFMMFQNVYSITADGFPSLTLMLMGPLSVIALIILSILVVPRLVKENSRRGVIIQALFRSNYLLYGIPMTVFVFGGEKSGAAGIILAEMVTVFNVAAVIVLEMYAGRDRTGPWELLKKMAANPLLQGCLIGLAFFVLGIRLPTFIEKPVSALGSSATPLALITLGGTMEFSAMRQNRQELFWVLLLKLILLPVAFTLLGYALGLRGVELFLLLMIFATPVAVSSYPMAVNMNGDGPLAGQMVFVSTIASLFTIFGFIFTLSRMGLLV